MGELWSIIITNLVLGTYQSGRLKISQQIYLQEKKKKFQLIFYNDEIYDFLDVYIVQNRVFRLSKGLFGETYSIKEFTFEPHIAHQSFKLTAELHLTSKEILFILENLKQVKNRTIRYQILFLSPTRYPKLFKKIPQQGSFFFHFFKDLQSSKSWIIKFGIRFPEIYQVWFILSILHRRQIKWLST